MSITDDSTGLDQTWTEQTVVAFTAGTLNTVTNMLTEVEGKLKRGTLSATSSPTSTQVQTWLIRAKEELMQTKSYTFARRYASASITSGSYRAALPPDYNGGQISVRDQTNDRNIEIWPANRFFLKYPDVDKESTNEPIVCCIRNRELFFAPPTSAAITVEINYDRSGDDNTTTDFSYLPEVERFRCCDFALAEACEMLQDWERMKMYRQKWYDGLVFSRKADARRRWKDYGYRAISWFEESATRSYQP